MQIQHTYLQKFTPYWRPQEEPQLTISAGQTNFFHCHSEKQAETESRQDRIAKLEKCSAFLHQITVQLFGILNIRGASVISCSPSLILRRSVTPLKIEEALLDHVSELASLGGDAVTYAAPNWETVSNVWSTRESPPMLVVSPSSIVFYHNHESGDCDPKNVALANLCAQQRAMIIENERLLPSLESQIRIMRCREEQSVENSWSRLLSEDTAIMGPISEISIENDSEKEYQAAKELNNQLKILKVEQEILDYMYLDQPIPAKAPKPDEKDPWYLKLPE